MKMLSTLQLTGGAPETYSLGTCSPATFTQPREHTVPSKNDREDRQVVGFVGLGLDNKDGHRRLTRSDHFFLLGGSAETHERMQDTAIRFDETLRRRGKALKDTPVEEVIAIFHQAKE